MANSFCQGKNNGQSLDYFRYEDAGKPTVSLPYGHWDYHTELQHSDTAQRIGKNAAPKFYLEKERKKL
jgi:hypothetical protein